MGGLSAVLPGSRLALDAILFRDCRSTLAAMSAPDRKPVPPPTPADAEAAFRAAVEARGRGDWQASLGHMHQAIRLAPQEAKYHGNAGAALFMLGRHAEAAAAYEQALVLDPDHLSSLNNLAVIYSLGRKFKEAEDLLHRSLARDSRQKEAWLNLCSAVENLDYREEDVIAYARQAIALAPREAQGYRFLGKALLRKGDPLDALQALRTAATLEPGNADIPYSIGICHVQMDQVAEAIQAFQAALTLDPNHGHTYYALGEFLYRLDELRAAVEAAQNALELLDDKISAGKLLAKILFGQGRHQEARNAYVQARAVQNALLKQRQGLPIPRNKFVLAAVTGVEQWCLQRSLLCRETVPQAVWQARPPIILGSGPAHVPLDPAPIPHAYVAEVRDATVVPGHEIILVDREQGILYDRLVRMGDWHSLREDSLVPLIDNTHVLAECGDLAEKRVREGIFMFSEGWYNYAHWLIEQLPRLYSVERFPEYAGMPLLINEGLYPQQLESLRLASRDRYPIKILPSSHRHRVERLIVPSNLTQFIKRRYRPGERATTADGPFHPEAIRFLRDRLLPCCAGDARPSRRLWISRKTQIKAGQRRMINEAEIEALFEAYGFEILYPETLSFREQVATFANAEMIAGPAGAAMINMVFAPVGARVLIFTKDHPQVNFHYFTNIGQIVGFDVAHICGRAIENFGVHGFETDFQVDLAAAKHALKEFLGL
jgi:capsular polysaccharide biosynthesis protein/tetratricopeptide (TPR) repeat protein